MSSAPNTTSPAHPQTSYITKTRDLVQLEPAQKQAIEPVERKYAFRSND